MSYELTVQEKLGLAGRANEIYQQQIKYFTDHLKSLRELIQDKEDIIQNLKFRYEEGFLTKDSSIKDYSDDQIDDKMLCKKANSLAELYMLQNFGLRVK